MKYKIRNDGIKDEMINLFYDILCLDKFTENMLLFENEIIYNDPLTFSSLIGIQLTQSKLIQNIIKSSKQSSIYKNNANKNNNQNNSQNIDQQIVKNLQEKATDFVNNLTYLSVTGYAIMIINAISNNNNNNNIDIIECLSNLCLSHPMIILLILVNLNLLKK